MNIMIVIVAVLSTSIVLAVGVCMGMAFARAIDSSHPKPPEVAEPPTEEIPGILPMFSGGNQVLYYRANYLNELHCMDPSCGDPHLTDGQAVEVFRAGGSHLAVCLDCMERNTKTFAAGME